MGFGVHLMDVAGLCVWFQVAAPQGAGPQGPVLSRRLLLPSRYVGATSATVMCAAVL